MSKGPRDAVLWRSAGICLLLSLFGAAVSQPHTGARYYRGAIGVPTEWEGLIRVTGKVTVKRGVTLTVAPGTRVLVNGGQDVTIVVEGKLYVRGLPEMKVLFEPADGCSEDSTWEGIRFSKGASGIIERSEIRCAKKGIWGELSGVKIIEVVTDSAVLRR